MLNLILQSDVAAKMDFGYERAGNASHLQTGFVNKWRRLFYKSSTSETIEVRKYISSYGIFKIDLYRQDLQRTELSSDLFSKLQTFMRATTELDSSTFLNFKDHRRMKTKDNLSDSCIKPFIKFEVYYFCSFSPS